MKKEIALEMLWHEKNISHTFPVSIVTTIDKDGQVNAAPFALILPFCISADTPQMLLISCTEWHTSKNIEETGEFVINYAPYSLMKKVTETSLFYPDGVNEIDKAGLTALPALHVKPPRIEECYQHIECRLNHVAPTSNELQNNFVGDVLAVTADNQLLNKGQLERALAADPLLYYGMSDLLNFKANFAGIDKAVTYTPPKIDITDED
jgi:flavin reductase (DIM6/NTAB) family NADH-FMN oxidoreductase RutF